MTVTEEATHFDNFDHMIRLIIGAANFKTMDLIKSVRLLYGPSRIFSRIISDKYYSTSDKKVGESPKMKEFREKLRQKTPIGKLDEIEGKHPYQEQEPLPSWPNNTNPHTGEINGPRGPEPTRYGDWERKGRVSDF